MLLVHSHSYLVAVQHEHSWVYWLIKRNQIFSGYDLTINTLVFMLHLHYIWKRLQEKNYYNYCHCWIGEKYILFSSHKKATFDMTGKKKTKKKVTFLYDILQKRQVYQPFITDKQKKQQNHAFCHIFYKKQQFITDRQTKSM